MLIQLIILTINVKVLEVAQLK